MLYYLLAVLYVLSCLMLLLVVLLQQGKGGDMASAFGGGGSQTAFGARAGATVLTKATAVLGALFMIGAIALGIFGQRGELVADGRLQSASAGAGARTGNARAATAVTSRRRSRRHPRRRRKKAPGRTAPEKKSGPPNAKVAELADAPA